MPGRPVYAGYRLAGSIAKQSVSARLCASSGLKQPVQSLKVQTPADFGERDRAFR